MGGAPRIIRRVISKPKPPPRKQRLPIDRGRGNFANNWK